MINFDCFNSLKSSLIFKHSSLFNYLLHGCWHVHPEYLAIGACTMLPSSHTRSIIPKSVSSASRIPVTFLKTPWQHRQTENSGRSTTISLGWVQDPMQTLSWMLLVRQPAELVTLRVTSSRWHVLRGSELWWMELFIHFYLFISQVKITTSYINVIKKGSWKFKQINYTYTVQSRTEHWHPCRIIKKVNLITV